MSHLSSKSISSFLLCALLAFSAQALASDTAKAPKGWEDINDGDTRILSNGEVWLIIQPWELLQGQSGEQWLKERADSKPFKGKLLSTEALEKKSETGPYSITRTTSFKGKTGYSVLFMCQNEQGLARLSALEMHNSDVPNMLLAGQMISKVCLEEPKLANSSISSSVNNKTQEAAPLVPLASITEQELRSKNKQILAHQRPEKANMFSYSGFSGFPASYYYKVAMAIELEKGILLRCLEWDPAVAVDLKKLAETNKCKIPSKAEIHEVKSFKPGERLSLVFGNINSFSIDGLEGSATSFSGSGVKMNLEGEVFLDRWRASHASSTAATARATSARKKNVRGRYYLDGYTITIVTDEGETLNGFIGYTGDNSANIGALFLNGKHYWDKDK